MRRRAKPSGSARLRALEARVRALETPPGPVWAGPRFTSENVKEAYGLERVRGSRFVTLVVAPDLAVQAVSVMEELNLRALQQLEADAELMRGEWRLEPFLPPVSPIAGRIVGA